MRSANYREKAVFKRLDAEAVDAYGQPHSAWEALFTRWGDFMETKGRERVETGAIRAQSTGTLRVRYSTATAGITEADMVTIRGHDWNIRSITQVDRKKKQLEMVIEKGVSM